jgi:hypothetical protein
MNHAIIAAALPLSFAFLATVAPVTTAATPRQTIAIAAPAAGTLTDSGARTALDTTIRNRATALVDPARFVSMPATGQAASVAC